MNESETLQNIRRLGRRGAYREAAAFADALPSGAIRSPPVALERARLRMRQGRMNKAREALRAAYLSAATQGERLILALESASLRIYLDAAIGSTALHRQPQGREVRGEFSSCQLALAFKG